MCETGIRRIRAAFVCGEEGAARFEGEVALVADVRETVHDGVQVQRTEKGDEVGVAVSEVVLDVQGVDVFTEDAQAFVLGRFLHIAVTGIPAAVEQRMIHVVDQCALVGGETAEMPGFYPVDEYDLAGFSVGVVDKDKILDNTRMAEGDVIIALPSSGVHSNGFSLVRKIFDIENADLKTPMDELEGKSLGETLLTPTKIYVKPMLALFDEVDVKAVSHITGGGFYENIPRSIPDGFCAKIAKDDVRVLPIFKLLQKCGNVSEHDMFNTYNMGVGMAVVVAKTDADKAIEILKSNGEDAYVLGEIVKGSEKIELY